MTERDGISFDFRARNVLVTGASSGIGLAIARAFRDAGAAVTVTGTGPAETYEADFDEMRYRRLDVRDGAAVTALAEEIPALDVLVNAAGTSRPGGRSEFEPEAFAAALDINLAGSFRPAQAFLAQLSESRGAVVNIASMSSYFGLPTVPGYTAAKGGVVAMTRALAVAWAARGIRVNAIAPGWVRTKLTQPVIADPDRNRAILARTPLGRWAEPDEMAGAVLFLCSPAAGFITGVTLPVDGGYSAA